MEKTIYSSVLRGGDARYDAPSLEILDICVEKGFIVSPNFGEDDNEPGGQPDHNSYGEF